MSTSERTGSRIQGRTYTNGVMTVIAGLLGMLAMHQIAGVPADSRVMAQRVTTSTRDGSVDPGPRQVSATQAMGIPNAADQRARMISTLDSIEQRLSKIEGRLAGPLEVRVLEMPEVKLEGAKPQ